MPGIFRGIDGGLRREKQQTPVHRLSRAHYSDGRIEGASAQVDDVSAGFALAELFTQAGFFIRNLLANSSGKQV